MEIYKLVFSPLDVNTYILADSSGDCAIIDCGCFDPDEFSRLEELVSNKNLKPVLLLNTHCHLDHIFGNRFMMEKYSLGSYCHREDEYNRENAVKQAAFFGLVMEAPPAPSGFISDCQRITFGETELEALLVPGHTRGSLAYYSRIDSVVFTGDALFSGSIGRTDLPGGDFETLLKSIRTRLFTLPPETNVYPGHGEMTSIKAELKSNPFFIPD